MAADVRSIAAIQEWLTALSQYRSHTSEAISGFDMEVRRAFDWVSEQGSQWARAARHYEEAVVQAKAELSARKYPDFNGRMPDTTVQERNLRRAQARHEHAIDQIAKCRSWLGRLPKLIEETYSGPSRRLGLFLEAEVMRALARLDRQIVALETYAGTRIDFAPTPVNLSGPNTPPAPDQTP